MAARSVCWEKLMNTKDAAAKKQVAPKVILDAVDMVYRKKRMLGIVMQESIEVRDCNQLEFCDKQR